MTYYVEIKVEIPHYNNSQLRLGIRQIRTDCLFYFILFFLATNCAQSISVVLYYLTIIAELTL